MEGEAVLSRQCDANELILGLFGTGFWRVIAWCQGVCEARAFLM